jgi:hypothetical protein
MPVGEEILIKTENALVRVVELGPGEVARMYVRMKSPDEESLLLPGQRCTVAQGRIHQVVNADPTKMTYLPATARCAREWKCSISSARFEPRGYKRSLDADNVED